MLNIKVINENDFISLFDKVNFIFEILLSRLQIITLLRSVYGIAYNPKVKTTLGEIIIPIYVVFVLC